MIAVGLCMMGGCFAQDSSSQVVDTYWPAHSVRVDHETLILKPYGNDLLLPFWTEGVRAGGRLENVSWNEADNGGSNILNWGEWGTNVTSYEVSDAIFLGTTAPNNPNRRGAYSYSVCLDNQKRSIIGYDSPERFVAHMEIYAIDDMFFLSSSIGNAQTRVSGWPSAYNTAWQIRIKGQASVSDVVSFWWYNSLQNEYFMVQPMCSVCGDSALFTHGFDILTEL